MSDAVILLHGICQPSFTMNIFAKFLKKAGFKILNVSYPSTKHSLEVLIDIIHPNIDKISKETNGKVHFLSFSMGGLLARIYLSKYKLKNIGRVVMIAPPNNGSEIADYFKSFKIYKWLLGPCGQQLVTNQAALKKLFSNVNYELGIIAGNKNFSLLPSFKNKLNDGLVSVESTIISGLEDHIIIPKNHLTLLFSDEAKKQTLNFLKVGKFNH